ncbi:MAG: hypothetical protein WCK90_00220 [archaeon]
MANPIPLSPEQIIVATKMSKLEYDMQRMGLSRREVMTFYKKQSMPESRIQGIIDSHSTQKASIGILKKLIPKAKIISREEVSERILQGRPLVIAFGGDNHFQYVGHHLDDELILGINADTGRSIGALLSTNMIGFEKYLPDILAGNYQVEPRTRLQASIDGKLFSPLVISEVAIGEQSNFDMSRHILFYKGESEEQRGSGLIVATGSGSGMAAWYTGAAEYVFPKGDEFSKSSQEFRFVLRERHLGGNSPLKYCHGICKGSDSLRLTSLSDSQAVISIDSLAQYHLREGASVELKIAQGKPLNTLVIK